MRRYILFLLLILPIYSFASGSLSGNYSIGSGGDFSTISQAITELNSYGISGPVYFKLTDPYYNEQLDFSSNISGTSSSNTITFQSASSNAEDAYIYYTSTSSSNNFVVKVNYSNNLIFKDLTFTALGSSYSNVIVGGIEPKNISFISNIFNGYLNAGTSIDQQIVRFSSLNLDNINFDNNTFNYGSHCFYASGGNSNNFNFTNNKLNTNYVGISISGFISPNISNNEINCLSNGNAISIVNCNNFNIVKNKITCNTNASNGIIISGSNSTSSNYGLIANNFIQATNTGIQLANSDYIEIYFNSVNIENSPVLSNPISSAFSQDNNSSNIFIYNNMFVNNRDGYAYIGNSSSNNNSDNNNLYSTGTNLAQWDGTDYSSFSSFKSNSGTNTSSFNETVTFNSISDLHVQSTPVLLNGVDISSVVPDDIDGDIRNIPPKIGADEYNFYVGNVRLTTQAEVNNFGANNYNSITGNLTIYNSSDITELTPLNTITSVGGYLSINNNSALTNLDGLNNISSVGSSLIIEYNDALTNLDGLSNTTSVGSYIYIGSNSALTNLNGLNDISLVKGNLGIEYNDMLINLDGLSNISSVVGYLSISGNSELTNLDGLNSITSVGGYLGIEDNGTITNLDGLSNIGSIGGNLRIRNNSALINIDGLSNITSIVGYLWINSNIAITNIDGLSNVTTVGGDLQILFNSQLNSYCGLDALITPGVSGDGLVGNYNVSGNNYNPSLADLEAGNCEATSLSLNIKVFLEGPYDSNDMNTSLNSSLPLQQPYSSPIHDGTESVSSGFFSSHPNIVDWVVVQLRSDETTIVASRAGFLLNTGEIVDVDGTSHLLLYVDPTQDYYAVVYQRNHLPVMSSTTISMN